MLSLLISSALAAPAGVQIAAFQPGLDFASETLSETSYDVVRERVGAEVGCWDEVGIDNLNVHIPLDVVDLELGNGSLLLDVHFGTIEGSEMVIYAEDSDTFDICPGFETAFNHFALENARVRVDLAPTVNDDRIEVEVLGEVTVTGDLSTDIDWVPDTLVMAFVEERIFEAVENLILERVPELIGEMVDTTLFAGEIGDMALDVQLRDVQARNARLEVGMDVDADWLGEACDVAVGEREPDGRQPAVDFGNGDGSAVGVAITERQVNELFFGAWSSGLLCFEAGPLQEIMGRIEDQLSETLEGADVRISFPEPPVLTLGEDGLRIDLSALGLRIRGEVDGETIDLLELEASLGATVELGIDHTRSSLVLSIVDADLSVAEFTTNAIVSDKAEAQDRLIAFLEGWAMETLAERIQDVPLYGNLLYIRNIYLRLDAIDKHEGALGIRGSLFNEDHPDVDTEAPNTSARFIAGDREQMQFAWAADDDSTGPFAYSYRIDSDSWSGWIAEQELILSTPDPGTHVFEVRARDAWLNTDASPAIVVFQVREPAAEKKGCACASQSSTPSGALTWLGLGMLGWLRRRR